MTEKGRKVALIMGITGQDGSYLAELLLSKGYQVNGIMRRSSSFNTERVSHIYQDPHEKDYQFRLLYGDLADPSALLKILAEVKPDEIYNLGAQSHVKVSFEIPEYTADIDAIGTLRLLEAIRAVGLPCKFYQASSSEMFGSSAPLQSEKTTFLPRSPYAISKVFAHHTTINYREAYGIFACSGILFNHETIASFMPMFVKMADRKEFDIKPICEIVTFDERIKQYQAKSVSGIQVWGKYGWVDVKYASAYPHNILGENKKPRFINSRSGAFMATGNHVAFMADGNEKETKDIEVGDWLETIDLPEATGSADRIVSVEEAELMGMMVGDGSFTHEKHGIGIHGKFTNSSFKMRTRFDYLWHHVTGGKTTYYPTRSGFNPDKIVGQLGLAGGNEWLRKLDIYNQDRTKRIPKVILNSSREVMHAFLDGYNATDGLKANLCTYEFKNFKTNSATLAMGVWYLIECVTGQDVNLTVETKEDGRVYYSLNLLSTIDNGVKEAKVHELVSAGVSQRGIERMSGISRTFIRKIQYGGSHEEIHHLRKVPFEVKKIIDMPNYNGWFYDLETSSEEFHCGVGKIHVHNSPRRGETFVTRKITRAVARILNKKQEKLFLGNLDAERDWGYAPEYVESMWKMMQQEKSDDYVIGTGEMHTVREFVEEAFRLVGLDSKKFVEIDKRYFRPTEVEKLCGDSSKAQKQLGWKPHVRFKDLVSLMLIEDLKLEGLDPSKYGLEPRHPLTASYLSLRA